MATADGRLLVKFVAKGPRQQNHAIWLRQFPGASGIWGPCTFVFDPDLPRYDWLVVYDDLPCQGEERFSTRREVLGCAPEHSLLITTEPVTVKGYSQRFLSQFAHVLTSQESAFIRHPNATFSQPGLHWFYGMGRDGLLTYDEMKAAAPPVKMGEISTVCSSKRQKHTLHNLRFEFTQRLKAALPQLAHFGHGVAPLDDKARALDPYRYHVAIENHISPHHWTEKLADPFLGYCLPFYCGCPNLQDYFSPDAFIPIDLFDFPGSLEIIRSALASHEYERRLPAILEARRLILDEYNLFALLSEFITARHGGKQSAAGGAVIYSRRASRLRHPLEHLGDSARRLWRLRAGRAI